MWKNTVFWLFYEIIANILVNSWPVMINVLKHCEMYVVEHTWHLELLIGITMVVLRMHSYKNNNAFT